MLCRIDLQGLDVTAKWHLRKKYELKLITRFWAYDRMVALSTVTEKEGCLEIMAGTPQMNRKQC